VVVRTVLSLSVPHFVINVRGKDYLIDAYFMRHISFPPRRSLLIFPPKGFKNDVIPNTKVVEGISSVHEVIDYLVSTYDYAVRSRVDEAVRTLRKFRASLVLPTSWFRSRPSDYVIRESVGATYILEGVFGREELLSGNVRISSWFRVFLPVTIEVRSNDVKDVSFKSPNERVVKTYKWLLINDEGFREAVSSILGIKLVREERFRDVDLRKLLKL